MPRRKNTRPTSIYWLVDVRPETIAAGWHNGLPFYCGKTVLSVHHRLLGHKWDAKACPRRKISVWLRDCGEHVRVDTVDVVPSEGDWAERERQWIRSIRHLNPNCANTADGGAGVPGLIASAETRRKMSESRTNPSAETRRKMSEAHRTSPLSRAARLRVGEANRGRKVSPQTLRKMREARAALSDDVKEKIRQNFINSNRNRVYSDMGARNVGRVHSAETRLKMRLSHLGQKRSAETCQRISEAKRNISPETRRKMSAAASNISDETRRKRSESCRLGQLARLARLRGAATASNAPRHESALL